MSLRVNLPNLAGPKMASADRRTREFRALAAELKLDGTPEKAGLFCDAYQSLSASQRSGLLRELHHDRTALLLCLSVELSLSGGENPEQATEIRDLLLAFPPSISPSMCGAPSTSGGREAQQSPDSYISDTCVLAVRPLFGPYQERVVLTSKAGRVVGCERHALWTGDTEPPAGPMSAVSFSTAVNEIAARMWQHRVDHGVMPDGFSAALAIL